MLRRYLFFLLLNMVANISFAQPADSLAKVITISNTVLKDCITTRDHIWILDESGKLVCINKADYRYITSLQPGKKVIAITQHKDTVYAANEDGIVFTFNSNGDTKQLWKTNQKIYRIVFNSQNKCFLATTKGIYDPVKEQLYTISFVNLVIYPLSGYEEEPSAVLVDKDDNIWLGIELGEFGGGAIIFSTKKLEFIRLSKKQEKSCYLNPVRSLFQVGNTVYATTSSRYSFILGISDKCGYLFESPLYVRTKTTKLEYNLYDSAILDIGPGAFNDADSCIYFHSQFGVFKGHIKKDLSKIENWELDFDPDPLWYDKRHPYRSHGGDVSKMFFEDNKLFLVRPYIGILIRDKNKTILLKKTF